MIAALAGCSDAAEPDAYAWALPPDLEPPPAPERNATTRAKVELGSRLFSDSRLSADGRHGCVSCHDPALAFSDPNTPSLGVYGDALPRQAPSLANVGYLAVYTWANPLLTSLEGQALVPLLAKRPAELDLADRLDRVLAELASDAALAAAFRRAFPGESPAVTLTHVTDALAAFQRTLVSAGSDYDRLLAGDSAALSAAAERGHQLFFSERLGCGGCHRGRWLTDAAEPLATIEEAFHNTGLYNLGDDGSYPRASPGLIEFSGKPEDRGKFRTPPLRNLTLTAPFMHDGSVATLHEVIDHYAAGGRTIGAGPLAGVGADNPNKDSRVRGFDISEGERDDLIAFLESLTDPDFPVESASVLASATP
jgi:cytochrome c peroxidase